MQVHLRKIEPEQNQQRFYHLTIAPTLFGEWALIREFGRIGHHGGRVLESWYASEAAACDALRALRRSKERRGYVPLDHV